MLTVDDQQAVEWTAPEFVALTDTDARPDEPDMPVRNGGS